MKKLLSACAALAAVCLIAPAHAGVKIEHWVAASGARVYFVETHALPILDVKVDFSAGAAYDPPGKSGLADLTRSLLDAGAGDMDEEAIAGRFVDLGVRFAGGSDYDRAGLSLRTLTTPSERDAGLDLLRTILARPTFPPAPLAREKTRTIAEIEEADTRPDAIAAKRFAAAIYPGHPYGIAPTAASVAGITRDDIVAFHRDHYAAARAVISIIGDVSRGQAEAIAQRLTEGLPPGVAATPLAAVTSPAKATIRVAHPATQSHIHIGLPALKRGDADFYALQVGNYSLGGGGFVSRLMKEVREKRGYAYSVYSYFSPRKLEGPFEIGLQTKREQAGAALKVAQDVLAEFLAHGPTAQELAAAKKHLVDSLALGIDSNAKLLNYVSVIGFYQLPLTYLDDFPAKVQAVTAQDVRAAFKRHVDPDHLVTVIVATDEK
ncbi:MAG: pitrilysin family protein [Rhodocyclaceae bacterium]|nr:pitrilysin family protein [Rhodocyclaceae bacterium]